MLWLVWGVPQVHRGTRTCTAGSLVSERGLKSTILTTLGYDTHRLGRPKSWYLHDDGRRVLCRFHRLSNLHLASMVAVACIAPAEKASAAHPDDDPWHADMHD